LFFRAWHRKYLKIEDSEFTQIKEKVAYAPLSSNKTRKMASVNGDDLYFHLYRIIELN
jgi:hypothetical protein